MLPPGWSKDAARTRPTVWVLHGGFDDHKSWTDKGDLEALTAAEEAILVLPETSWCSAYSNWYNDGRGGPPAWESYLLDDVRALLESGYRADTTRAVAGNSMGGLGAMKFAAAHPGWFNSAASFSGNVDPLHDSGAPRRTRQAGPGLRRRLETGLGRLRRPPRYLGRQQSVQPSRRPHRHPAVRLLRQGRSRGVRRL